MPCNLTISPERLDLLYLRAKAIQHFKEEFPEYKRLCLSLRDENLIVALKSEEDLGNVIRKIHDIKGKSIIAIGISHVILEVEGTEKMRVGNMVGTIDVIENIENGTQVQERQGNRIDAPSIYPMPKGIKFLTSIEEVAAFGKMTAADLVACLDEEVQTRYKIDNRQQVEAIASRIDLDRLGVTLDQVLQIIPLHGLSNELGIEPENLKATVAWYWLYRGAEAFASIPVMAQESINNLLVSPLNKYINIDTAPTPTRRGRKANDVPEEVETTTTEDTEKRTTGTVFRGASKITNDEDIMNLLKTNKFTAFVGKVLETQKTKSSDRTGEMIESAVANDNSWQRFFAPIMKAYLNELPEGDREKAEKKAISGILKAFRAKSSNNNSEASA